MGNRFDAQQRIFFSSIWRFLLFNLISMRSTKDRWLMIKNLLKICDGFINDNHTEFFSFLYQYLLAMSWRFWITNLSFVSATPPSDTNDRLCHILFLLSFIIINNSNRNSSNESTLPSNTIDDENFSLTWHRLSEKVFFSSRLLVLLRWISVTDGNGGRFSCRCRRQRRRQR